MRTFRSAPCLMHAEKVSSALAACTQSLRAAASAAKYRRCSSHLSIFSCFLHRCVALNHISGNAPSLCKPCHLCKVQQMLQPAFHLQILSA